MKKFTVLTLVMTLLFSAPIFAQDARYHYGPVAGINLDDMLAIAAKTFENRGVKVDRFNYSRGMILSTNYGFTILVSPYRTKILVENTDDGVYLSFIDLQMKSSSGGWTDVASVLGKKTDKLMTAIGKEFEAIAKDPKQVEAAKTDFYNDPRTHYLFFKKATELAAERWYERFMKDKVFDWTLKFSDIKKNESKSFPDFKYVVTARYYTGSALSVGSGGLYVKLYTNDDSNMMTEKGTKIKVKGKCVKVHEYMGIYYIDFTQE